MEMIDTMKTSYNVWVPSGTDREPVDHAGTVDVHQLLVPRKPRTPRIQVQVQAPSDGDESMTSSGSGSDSKDLDYEPGNSDRSE